MPKLLNEVEAGSQAWHKIKEHCETRLSALRKNNDGDLSPEQTAKLRGRIKELKYLLALDQDDPAPARVASDD